MWISLPSSLTVAQNDRIITLFTMSTTTVRTLLALFILLFALSPGLTAHPPLRPRNVKLTAVEKGLIVTWDPPSELDVRPVDRYNIGYGKSMKALRFIRVDKDKHIQVLEDLEPGVLHFLKMTAENSDGLSKPVYGAETPKAQQVVSRPVRVTVRSSAKSVSVPWKTPSSSGPEQQQGQVKSYALAQNDRAAVQGRLPADQRPRQTHKLASESVYVVSLQAQTAHGQSSPFYKAVMTNKKPSDPEELYEAKDITVRVMSPQSVLVTWVDPAIEKEKSVDLDSRHYTVRYREKGESARWDYKETGQRRLLLDTLNADNMYEFSVRISQAGREGKWSASVFQRTPESAPTGPPENFLVKPVRGKGTAVTASWEPPEEPNGRIREYILSYAPALKPFGAKTITYHGGITSAMIDGLQPGERYIFKIRATNRRGQGPQTKAFSVAMPTTSTVSSTSPQRSKNQDSQRASHSSSRTSKLDFSKDSKGSDLQSTEETDELPTAPAPRKSRPLSQTRSYHSVFSSVRSSVRNGHIQRAGFSSHSQEEDREKNENAQRVQKGSSKSSLGELEDDLDEEGNIDQEQPLNQPSKTLIEMSHSKDSTSRTDSSPDAQSRTTPLNPSSDPHPRTPTNRRVASVASPNTGSSKLSRPYSTPVSRKTTSTLQSKNQEAETSSTLSISQESSVMGKDHTDGPHPGRKERYHHSTENKPTTASPKETFSKLPEERSAQPQGGSMTRTGSEFVNGKRRVGGHHRGRVLNGLRKPGSSSTVPQSTLPVAAKKPQGGAHSSNVQPETTLQENWPDYKVAERGVKAESPTSTSRGISSRLPMEDIIKNENPKDVSTQDYNYDKSSSEVKPGGTLSFQNRRLGVGRRITPKKEITVLSGRATSSSSSFGAQVPFLKEGPLQSEVSVTKETDDVTKSTTDMFPSKNAPTSGSSNPSLSVNNAVLSGSTNPIKSASSNGQTETKNPDLLNSGSDNDEGDLVYHRGRDGYEKNDKTVETLPHKSTTATVNKHHGPHSTDDGSLDRDIHPSKTGSPSVPSFPQRGPNGRFRSPAQTNRQTGLRFKGRLLPAQHTKLGSSNPLTGSSHLPSSSSLPQPALSPDQVSSTNGGSSRVSSSQLPRSSSRHTTSERAQAALSIVPNHSLSQTSSGSQQLPPSFREPAQGTRTRYPTRGITQNTALKPIYQGKNGRPNLTVTNGKVASTSNENTKPAGRKFITGPDGVKWVVDFDKGVLMNEDGRILQDSQGRPRRVVLGEDGRTIFDDKGSPLVNPDGLALFGHGRDSRPVINPKDKFFTLGGKPMVGLDRPKPSTTTTTTTTATTTTPTTTTTTTTTTPTTVEPSTAPTTTEMTTEEPTTVPVFPTCPPGTYSKMDDRGFPQMDEDGVLNCYPEDVSSGMDMDAMVTASTVAAMVTASTVADRADAFAFKEEDFVIQTTLIPTTKAPTQKPDLRPINSGPSSEFDLAGKQRFKAPYINYIRRDPGAPCSLTEALEYLQVDVLENLFEKDSQGTQQPPKSKPLNITVVAMEGCHSFVILDWARPMKDDMVSGYMVHSASFDDVLNNRWSSSSASGTHLAVENLKPNSRYYFKVQAKNAFGLGPISDTFKYVTESDDPLLIERPPGGEPIWIPFTFKYNPAQSSCKGSQFVKRTWYRKFVGVVLCNSLRYKIFMGEELRDTFYSIGDTYGHGEDHCQFVDSYLEGRTGPHNISEYRQTTQGFFRAYRQEPVQFGQIGRRTPHPYVGWYECGVPIPGKW